MQENCIDLVGRIADRGPEFVSAREWMRICFELLELLKAHKKAIRRATVNTFGYIAKAIGPHDVLATLLNNLKVQERQNRLVTYQEYNTHLNNVGLDNSYEIFIISFKIYNSKILMILPVMSRSGTSW